jgi:hypothetical protein
MLDLHRRRDFSETSRRIIVSVPGGRGLAVDPHDGSADLLLQTLLLAGLP